MKNFKNLMVWQKSMDVVDRTFDIIDAMDRTTQFVLASQIGRSAVSVPSNISEGSGRNSSKDFARFLDIAIGSSFELETQLIICQRRKSLKECGIDGTLEQLMEVQKMLFGLLKKVRE